MKTKICICLAIPLLLMGCGWHNRSTAAGYVGYVYKKAVLAQAGFDQLQTGPSSTGMRWMVEAIPVSITPYNYPYKFEGENAVVAKDRLKVEFTLHVSWQVRYAAVQDFVENYCAWVSGQSVNDMTQDAFDNYVQPQLLTLTRLEVEKLPGLTLNASTGNITRAIKEKLDPLLADTPFEIKAINMDSPRLPQKVTQANSDALQAQIRLSQKDTEIDIKKTEKATKISEAQGIADSMVALSNKLTPQYLAYEGLVVQRDAEATNHSTIYILRGQNVQTTMPVEKTDKTDKK